MARPVQHIVIKIDDCHTQLCSFPPVSLYLVFKLYCAHVALGFHQIHHFCHGDHCVLAQLPFLAPHTSSEGFRVYRIWRNIVCFFYCQVEYRVEF